MDVFKVATIDQNLFLSGEKLLDNTQSLGQLRVLPGSAIFLKVSNVVNVVGAVNVVERTVFIFSIPSMPKAMWSSKN